MSEEIIFSWVDWASSKEDWEMVDTVIASRGWMHLNPHFSRVLIAKQGKKLAGFVVLQMVPHTEPLFVAPDFRGTGLAATLSDKMIAFMRESKARGWMAIASNSLIAAECERQGMKRVMLPVYAFVEGAA